MVCVSNPITSFSVSEYRLRKSVHLLLQAPISVSRQTLRRSKITEEAPSKSIALNRQAYDVSAQRVSYSKTNQLGSARTISMSVSRVLLAAFASAACEESPTVKDGTSGLQLASFAFRDIIRKAKRNNEKESNGRKRDKRKKRK